MRSLKISAAIMIRLADADEQIKEHPILMASVSILIHLRKVFEEAIWFLAVRLTCDLKQGETPSQQKYLLGLLSV